VTLRYIFVYVLTKLRAKGFINRLHGYYALCWL